MINEKLKERFLKYIKFDTQSDDSSNTIPSTMKQKDLGKYLEEELKSIGLSEAFMDEVGYVYGFLPSNCGSNTTIGLIAHMDTSDEASGKDVKAQIISSYDGGIIVLNEALGLKLDPSEFNYLNSQIGHELITTDGTTLYIVFPNRQDLRPEMFERDKPLTEWDHIIQPTVYGIAIFRRDQGFGQKKENEVPHPAQQIFQMGELGLIDLFQTEVSVINNRFFHGCLPFRGC